MICAAAHSFDVAKQGYVSLLDGRSRGLRSDTSTMVAARERVHGAGAFDPVAAAVAEIVSAVIAETVGPAGPVHPYGPVVADIGCGTGHYLAAVLDARPDARGIGIDLSKSCARATVRSHIRSAAVVADAWSGLPIRSSSVAAVLSVFSPRNVADFARILRPGGVVVTVTPEPGHLAELAGPMDMLRIAEDKDARLDADMAAQFEPPSARSLTYRVDASAALVADLVAMGPTAFHRGEAEIAASAQAMAGDRSTVPVTVAVRVAVFPLQG
ncbi:methyltransferase domain-containing protein [Gordonia sp. (in: high G+C Gram-positive bacteria)]|uniref:methyltransferase domain-containing protein n=1 Tax=Gordonia sp. (in: high G+C Gram-positive bacteria) TaxID=84139 RepID=UPI00338EFCBB